MRGASFEHTTGAGGRLTLMLHRRGERTVCIVEAADGASYSGSSTGE